MRAHKRSILAVLALLGSTTSFGHGERKLGPNGGFIRMPGAFHTEVVAASEREIFVYLLDLNNSNPVTNGSTVTLRLKSAAAPVDVVCVPEALRFKCALPASASLKSGELILFPSRLGMPASPALYPLPLRLEQGAP